MDGCYPNAHVAYRILLTIPVTVASAERSFSKLKLIKTYLRSTMSQERLNDLAMLSIEKKVVAKVDYAKLIDTFASKTARRVVFKNNWRRLWESLLKVVLLYHLRGISFKSMNNRKRPRMEARRDSSRGSEAAHMESRQTQLGWRRDEIARVEARRDDLAGERSEMTSHGSEAS
ncbi:hypothetical protein ACLB2K_004615 [Fragaria x ananassa]